MILLVVGLIAGLTLLFFGGNWLVQGASRLARSIGMSPLVVGLTIVAIGTSAPELIVSISAALSDSADITVGNVIGSNVANIGLILGISAMIYPISVTVTMLRREIPIMLVVTLITVWMFQDFTLARIEGVILLILLVIFLAFMIYASRKEQKEPDIPEHDDGLDAQAINRGRELLRFLVGITVLIAGAQLTVSNAVELARNFGVSELVIGITVVAIGTSLPELVASVAAAWRKASDLAIGNVIGSNIMNLLLILGASTVIQPIDVAPAVAQEDSLVMVGFSVLMLPFLLDRKLGRIEGGLFVAAYIIFTIYTIYTIA